ncbi:MAG: hypothetical protein JWM34_3401 [Ilumatobacteraceae bacterium]|nr:hypothetical protein [Ilumatobacteraceae bacterium]
MSTTHEELDRSDVRAVHRRDAGRIFRFVLAAALIAVLVIVALDNTDKVRVGYAIGDAQAPIWMVLVLAAVAGVIIGWLARHRPGRHTS